MQELTKQLERAEHELLSMEAEYHRLHTTQLLDVRTCDNLGNWIAQLEKSIAESQLKIDQNQKKLCNAEQLIDQCFKQIDAKKGELKEISIGKDNLTQECNDFLSQTVVPARVRLKMQEEKLTQVLAEMSRFSELEQRAIYDMANKIETSLAPCPQASIALSFPTGLFSGNSIWSPTSGSEAQPSLTPESAIFYGVTNSTFTLADELVAAKKGVQEAGLTLQVSTVLLEQKQKKLEGVMRYSQIQIHKAQISLLNQQVVSLQQQNTSTREECSSL